MLYVQQFQNNRVDYLKQHQHLRSAIDQNFSLCSNQYIKKFPKSTRPETSNIPYIRDQTVFFLSQKSSLLEMKSTNENQHQTGIIQKNKNSTTNASKSSLREEDKQISNDNTSNRWYHQVSRNMNGLTKSTPKGNSMLTSFSLPMQSSTEACRPTTAPLILEENPRRTISARIKYNAPSRTPNLRVIDLIDNFDTLTKSPSLRSKPPIFESHNQNMQESDTSSQDHSLDSSVVTHRPDKTTINGFQHIANLGSWQHNTKNRHIESSKKSPEIEYEENRSSERIYEYKSPFSEEYDQAISLQAQFSTNTNLNDWNVLDFYRDVNTPFEAGTNTQPVFEKCLKLSRLQANTVKWEQRRRQNLNSYNRLIKTSTTDNNMLNFNENFPSNLTELKRELRCNGCKRVTCLGNCAPGQEYHQYKRVIPPSPFSNTREQIRDKLTLRTQRSMIDLRPRSQQQTIRPEQRNFNPQAVVPLFGDDSQTKRTHKKLTPGFLPQRSFRSQRREALTMITSHKILS